MTRDPIDYEITAQIAAEIDMGFEWGDERSKVPQTDEYREEWALMAEEAADIERQGFGVYIPPA